MVLFEFEYQEHSFKLISSAVSGKEQLSIDDEIVTQKYNFKTSSEHSVNHKSLGELLLTFQVKVIDGKVVYQLNRNSEVVYTGETDMDDILPFGKNKLDVGKREEDKKPSHFIGLFGIGLKLFKSAKAIKVLLAGSALAGWSIIFSWEFALVLIAVIMFHEYGHVWAMKKMGMKTKGFYIIPFVGGVAIGDKAKTHWQQVFIAMMGPSFGLVMSIVFYLIYLATESHWIGLMASVSALLNIFNLLPVMPLDGGQVVKSIVFSGRSKWQFISLLVVSAAAFALSINLGLSLLSFFIVLGVIDLVFSYKEFKNQAVEAMDRYSSVFSLVWYLLTVVVFVGIILAIASSGLPGSELATTVLQS
jgi:Zn-dependent protease